LKTGGKHITFGEDLGIKRFLRQFGTRKGNLTGLYQQQRTTSRKRRLDLLNLIK
jgi:hypothetical protein